MADDSQRIKYVYVDSANRDTTLYPSGNTYTLHLTNPVHSVVRVDLVAAKVPNTMYNVTDGSNIFTFTNTSTAVSNVISISPGYYSAFGLGYALASASGTLFAVDFISVEGHFIFSSNVTNFTIEANTAEAQKVLGLEPGAHASFTGASSPVYALDATYGPLSLYKSTIIVDLSTNEYVFLDVEQLRTTSVIDTKKLVGGTTEGSSIRSTFGMIPLDVPSGNIKNYKETTDYKQYILYNSPIPKIDRLTVRWIDSAGRSLNFQTFENNAFTLRIHCEYHEPPPPTPPLQDIQIQRIVDAMSMVPPPPKPPDENRVLGRWVIVIIIIGFVAAYVAYVRLLRPLVERLNAAPPPPPPFKPKISLY